MLSNQLRQGAFEEAGQLLPYVHEASDTAWDSGDPEAIAKLLRESIQLQPEQQSALLTTLWGDGTDEALRLDRVGSVYAEAFKTLKPEDVATHDYLTAHLTASRLDSLSITSRLAVVGSMASSSQTKEKKIDYSFDPLEAYETIVGNFNLQEMDDEALSNLLKARPYFTDTTDETFDVLLTQVTGFFVDKDGIGRKRLKDLVPADEVDADEEGWAFMKGMRVGSFLAIPTLEALEEYPERLTAMATQLLNAGYVDTISVYVEENLSNNKSLATELYEIIETNRLEVLSMDSELVYAYARNCASNGRIDRAIECVAKLDYSNSSWVYMMAAEWLFDHGAIDQGKEYLDTVYNFDPVRDFEGREDVEGHIGYMDGTPRGLILEYLAEKYMKFGYVEEAVTSYANSRRYPMQTENRLAESAVKSDSATRYAEVIAGLESVDSTVRAVLMSALLDVANGAYGVEAENQGKLQAVHESARQLAVELRAKLIAKDGEAEFRKGLYSPGILRELYAKTLDVEEAQLFIDPQATHGYKNGEVTKDLVVTLAQNGRLEEAWRMYMDSQWRPIEGLSRDRTTRALLECALLKADFDTSRAVLEEVPGYNVTSMLQTIYKKIGDKLPEVPEWLARTFLGSRSQNTGKYILRHLVTYM